MHVYTKKQNCVGLLSNTRIIFAEDKLEPGHVIVLDQSDVETKLLLVTFVVTVPVIYLV